MNKLGTGQIRSILSKDGVSVSLQLEIDGTAIGYITYDAMGLDDLIGQLGQLRSRMSERVVPTLDPSAIVPIEMDPVVQVFLSDKVDRVVLTTRYSGLGWQGNGLTEKVARRLGEILIFEGETLRRRIETAKRPTKGATGKARRSPA